MGDSPHLTEALIAVGMMLSGAILIAAWLPSDGVGPDWPAIIGVVLVGFGFVTGIVVALQAGRGQADPS